MLTANTYIYIHKASRQSKSRITQLIVIYSRFTENMIHISKKYFLEIK